MPPEHCRSSEHHSAGCAVFPVTAAQRSPPQLLVHEVARVAALHVHALVAGRVGPRQRRGQPQVAQPPVALQQRRVGLRLGQLLPALVHVLKRGQQPLLLAARAARAARAPAATLPAALPLCLLAQQRTAPPAAPARQPHQSQRARALEQPQARQAAQSNGAQLVLAGVHRLGGGLRQGLDVVHWCSHHAVHRVGCDHAGVDDRGGCGRALVLQPHVAHELVRDDVVRLASHHQQPADGQELIGQRLGQGVDVGLLVQRPEGPAVRLEQVCVVARVDGAPAVAAHQQLVRVAKRAQRLPNLSHACEQVHLAAALTRHLVVRALLKPCALVLAPQPVEQLRDALVPGNWVVALSCHAHVSPVLDVAVH
mmetsp:Transcript_20341/g.51532  ORF Transcript_20341/g.51532 Transcript_20341/m.51532 type:complete len:367 (-) Transcript_20341:600-1700(-)